MIIAIIQNKQNIKGSQNKDLLPVLGKGEYLKSLTFVPRMKRGLRTQQAEGTRVWAEQGVEGIPRQRQHILTRRSMARHESKCDS